jgi:hypothetical protein
MSSAHPRADSRTGRKLGGGTSERTKSAAGLNPDEPELIPTVAARRFLGLTTRRGGRRLSLCRDLRTCGASPYQVDDEYEHDWLPPLRINHSVFAFAVRRECSIVASIFRIPETAPQSSHRLHTFYQAAV